MADALIFSLTFVTSTFKSDPKLLKLVFQMWNDTVTQIINVAGISYSLNFQPISQPMIAQSQAQGGNSLGLTESDGPLVLCLLSASWNLKTDDSTVITAGRTLFDKIDLAAKSKGLFREFKYLNYAAEYQRPIDSYGSQNKAKLQKASKKYDPSGLFQRAVPGGFKLFG